MPRKKKTDAEAPVPTISSTDSGIPKNHTRSQEYDSETVETILNYDTRKYLNADSLAAYDDASDVVREANEKRATAIMNPTSDEYTETRNGIRGAVFSVAFEEKRHYEALAVIAFVTRYGEPEYIPALEAAYRIAAEQIVTEQRDKLAKRLQTYGKSIDDAPKVDDALAADGVQYTNSYMPILSDTPIPHDAAEYDVLQLMSDGALADAFSTELEHISVALEKAYLARDSVQVATTRFISFLSKTGTDVLERKWTCGPEPAHLERITTFSPSSYITPLHKTMASHSKGILLHKNVVNQNRFKVDVGGNVKSTMSVVCNHDGIANMFLDGHITRYQVLVSDAVFTLLTVAEELNLPPRMTIQMIFAAMPGTNGDPNRDQIQEIDKCMRALRHLEVFYDGAQEFARKGISAPPLNDTFFAYRIMPGVDQRGNAVEIYDFGGRTPILLDIARKTKQVLTIPSEYIKVPGNLNADKRFIVRCLAQRVGHINSKNTDRLLSETLARIKLAALLEETGHGGATGAAATRLRTFFQKTLDHFAACGWIDGYEIIDTKGRKIEGSAHGRTPDYYQIIPRGGRKGTRAEALKKRAKE